MWYAHGLAAGIVVALSKLLSLSAVPADSAGGTLARLVASKRDSLRPDGCCRMRGRANMAVRSEEPTSEPQSLMRISYAVFCLKKKNNKNRRTTTSHTQTTKHEEKN